MHWHSVRFSLSLYLSPSFSLSFYLYLFLSPSLSQCIVSAGIRRWIFCAFIAFLAQWKQSIVDGAIVRRVLFLRIVFEMCSAMRFVYLLELQFVFADFHSSRYLSIQDHYHLCHFDNAINQTERWAKETKMELKQRESQIKEWKPTTSMRFVNRITTITESISSDSSSNSRERRKIKIMTQKAHTDNNSTNKMIWNIEHAHSLRLL